MLSGAERRAYKANSAYLVGKRHTSFPEILHTIPANTLFWHSKFHASENSLQHFASPDIDFPSPFCHTFFLHTQRSTKGYTSRLCRSAHSLQAQQ